MRSTFIECPRRFLWQYARHFKPTGESIHLHAGGAWATSLETARRAFYDDGKPSDEAKALGLAALIREYGDFQAPPNSNKTLDRMIEAYSYYFTVFPFETDPVQPYKRRDGKAMVEFSFALPLSMDLLHPETGEPILYSGRADMVATYAGALSIYDDKTTSSLGASWANQWNLRSQFSGYAWAAREYGIPVSQIVVRGISILKTKIDHAQVITVRTPHMIDTWHAQAIRDIRRAITCWEEGYWDVNLADGCSAFGGCLFQQPCMSADPEPWLTGGNYAVRIWDPLLREEKEITHDN
jgi:hypothetical protein